jgi:EmrB/QacA subfamily drug resistance transporter
MATRDAPIAAGQTDPGPPAPGAEQEVDPRRWIVLAVVLTAAFMVLLDISIVNVAIPSIQRDLNASYAQIQLVIALYALAYALLLITGGRLGDIVGRKRMFILGMSGFTLASALCGFAPNPVFLVASRVLQGGMAAMMYPQVLAQLQVSFPLRERPTAFAIFGAVIGLATITGPLLGGLLINNDILGLLWRPIFLVNLPVGIASVTAAFFLLHESRSPRPPRLDPIGVALVSIALFLLVYPLIEGRDAGWPLWSYLSLIASVPMLALFLLFERGKTSRDDSPLVDMRLFADRGFLAGIFVSMCFFAGIASFFLIFSLYLQIGLGFSALEAGLTTVPFAFGTFISSAISARLAARMGRSILQGGALVSVAGVAAVIWTIHAAGIDIKGYWLAPALFLGGIGLGLVVAPLINVVLAGIDRSMAGAASGVYTTVQQVGGAMGIALIGVIYFGQLGGNADAASATVVPRLRDEVASLRLPAPVQDGIVSGFTTCFHDRANEPDPTAIPPSCQAAQSQGGGAIARRIGAFAAAAGREALATDFSDSIQRSLFFNLGVFALAFLLMPLLPRAAGGGGGGGPGGH